MHKKLSKSIRAFSLALSIIAGSNAPSYAYVMNSFDSLANLTPGPNTSIAIDNVNYYEGTGSVQMSWNADINKTGSFSWTLPSTVDMTGEKISFMAYAPSDITQIGFELIDSSGNVAETWSWNVAPALYDTWSPFTVTQGSLSGATSYTVGTGNINQIAYGRWIETTNADGTRTNHWDTTPEPNTVLLIGTGLVFIAGLQRKKYSEQA